MIIGQEGQGVVPYLPLPELQKRAPAQPPGQTPAQGQNGGQGQNPAQGAN